MGFKDKQIIIQKFYRIREKNGEVVIIQISQIARYPAEAFLICCLYWQMTFIINQVNPDRTTDMKVTHTHVGQGALKVWDWQC